MLKLLIRIGFCRHFDVGKKFDVSVDVRIKTGFPVTKHLIELNNHQHTLAASNEMFPTHFCLVLRET